ncbi:MAG: TolC family protein, partial [Candidatus Hydrogenedentales bacterium]
DAPAGEESPFTNEELEALVTPPDLRPEIELDDEGPGGTIFDQIQIELLDIDKIFSESVRRREAPILRMSLDEVIYLTLAYNPDIVVSSFDPRLAFNDLLSAKGEFDPVLAGDARYTETSQAANPQTVAFGGITVVEQDVTNANASLSGVTPWGTQYDLTLTVDREVGTFTGFMEDFSARLTLTVTQPLLRGRGTNVRLARIRTARNNVGIAEAQLHLTVLNSVGEAIRAYWDLVGAIENLRVREESLSNAERLIEINERRLEIGTGAASEVLSAKAGAASRQSELISARIAIHTAENNLKRLLNMRDAYYFSANQIIPTERPSTAVFELIPERSMARALENRPEIKQARLEIENTEIERKRAKNDLLPQLDITGSFTTGGRANEIDRTFTGLNQQQDEVRSYGVVGSFPIGNRAARGSYTRARVSQEQAIQNLERTRQQHMTNVANAGLRVVENRALVQSNQRARQLQEANVAAEEKRLQLGISTSQNVLDFEEDLTAAQVQEVQAMVEVEKAIIDLKVAEGTLLENLGIEFELPDREKPEHTWRLLLD